MVSDDGVVPKTASVSVSVVVLDQNDNPPQFGEKIYSAEIFESADVGTPVVTVTAKDLDKESNGEVVYSMTGDQQGKVLLISSF